MTVKDRFHEVSRLSEIEYCVPGRDKILSIMENGGVPKPHTLTNRLRQFWTVITISSKLRFARFRNFYFRNQFIFEMLGAAAYGLSRELRVGYFVWYLQKLDFLD